jgi:hypothetical protein
MEHTSFTQILTDMPRRARKRNKKDSVRQTVNVFPSYHTNPVLPMGESVDKFIYEYSCAMLNLSDDIASHVCEWAKSNIPQESLYIDEDSGIDGYEDTPHVTVKYGLHDTNPDKLKELIEGYGPVKFKLGLVEKFDTNPDFDVLKITVESQSLRELNKIISDNMEHTDTFDEYKPHATLAYVKKNSCDDLISNTFFDKLEDEVYEIYFTSKTGDEHFLDL